LGSVICIVIGEQAPRELLGIHVNLPATVLPDAAKGVSARRSTARQLRR
jgi:hypothetical protein